MKHTVALTHEFCEFIPKDLQDGVLYVSVTYAMVAHRCLCGCGNKVFTPLSPTDWKLNFDGKTVSLEPSIGNWSFPCKSHYWIRHNKVHWAGRWSQAQINAGRLSDSLAKERYYNSRESKPHRAKHGDTTDVGPIKTTLWERLKKFWYG